MTSRLNRIRTSRRSDLNPRLKKGWRMSTGALGVERHWLHGRAASTRSDDAGAV